MLFGLFKKKGCPKMTYKEAIQAKEWWKGQTEYYRGKCERLNAEVIGVMKENDRLKQQLANAGLNDGGTCNATGPVMVEGIRGYPTKEQVETVKEQFKKAFDDCNGYAPI